MTDAAAPARWLIAEFEASGWGENVADNLGMTITGPRGSVYVQPIFTLKSVMGTGSAMRVTASDYADAGRWWL